MHRFNPMAAGVVCGGKAIWLSPASCPAFMQLLWPVFAFLGDLISRRAALALAFAVIPVPGSAEPMWEAIFLPSC